MRHWSRIIVSTLLIAAMVGAGAPTVVAARADGPGLLVRKNVLELSKGERETFVNAVRDLKDWTSPYDPTLSYYDQFVEWHLSLYRCSGTDFDIHAGHGGPFFLPWHRAFVRLFEKALQEVSGKKIAVPYWDWSDPESANPKNTKSVFQNDFMGGDGDANQGYAVTTGPFRKGQWKLTLAPEMLPWSASFQPHLVRRFSTEGRFPLPPVADVTWALERPAYDVAPYDMRSDPNLSFRNALEGWWRLDPTGKRYSDPVDHQHCGPDSRTFGFRDGGALHNRVHGWTGGIIGDPTGPTVFGTMVMPTSPSDPVFFLHHSNIDRLWAKWQANHPRSTFQPEETEKDAMEPFNSSRAGKFTPKAVESPADLGYGYSAYTDSDDVGVRPMEFTPATSPAARQTLPATIPTPVAATFAFGCRLAA